jgi:hypothetical protein
MKGEITMPQPNSDPNVTPITNNNPAPSNGGGSGEPNPQNGVVDVEAEVSKRMATKEEELRKQILKEIEDLLGDVFGYRQEPELDVVISMGECNRRRHLVVEYPYWKRKVKKFYSEGIKALLESNERFKGYSIDFTNYSREIE